MKEPRRRIIMITPDGTSLDNTLVPHSILQLTLRNLETYAIDITGIQYGFTDDNTVIPWDIYRASRIENVRLIEIFDSLAEERLEDERLADEQAQIEDEQMDIDDADAFSTGNEQEYAFVEPVIEAIKTWQRTNFPLPYVLTGGGRWGTEAEYLLRRGELVEFVVSSVNGVDSN